MKILTVLERNFGPMLKPLQNNTRNPENEMVHLDNVLYKTDPTDQGQLLNGYFQQQFLTSVNMAYQQTLTHIWMNLISNLVQIVY